MLRAVSNGAMFSFRLACEMSDVFAAIAPVAGHLNVSLSKTCAPTRPVSVMYIVGTEDKIVPYRGGQVAGPFGRLKLGYVISSDETFKLWVSKNTRICSTPAVGLRRLGVSGDAGPV